MEAVARIARSLPVPCILAVIPLRASADLPEHVERLAAACSGPVWISQHGADHRNRARPGDKADEFGGDDDDDLDRIRSGRRWLEENFPQRLINVFVPPWNRCTERTRRLVAEAGFEAVSGFSEFDNGWDATLDVQARYRPAVMHRGWRLRSLLRSFQGGGIMVHPAILAPQEVDELVECVQSQSEGRWPEISQGPIARPTSSIRGSGACR